MGTNRLSTVTDMVPSGCEVMLRDENGAVKCTACTLCEKTCPNGTIKITSQMVTPEEGKKKRQLVDYQ